MNKNLGLEILNRMSNHIRNSKGYENLVLKQVKLVSGGSGNCSAELKVGPEHLNGGGGLHGGFMATLVDAISTTALWTHDKRRLHDLGTSVEMHIRYLKGAKDGDDILIDAKTVKLGRSLAFVDVDIKDKTEGHIIARGSHTIYLWEPKKSNL